MSVKINTFYTVLEPHIAEKIINAMVPSEKWKVLVLDKKTRSVFIEVIGSNTFNNEDFLRIFQDSVKRNYTTVVEQLIYKPNFSKIEPKALGELLKAVARNGRASIIKMLLGCSRSPEISLNDINHALIRAAKYDHTECLEQLINLRPSDIGPKALGASLIEAAQEGSVSAVKLLLENPISAKISLNDINHALIRAAKYDHIKCLEQLINQFRPFDINPEALGVSLIEAAQEGSVSAVKLLLENPISAKISLRDLRDALMEIGNEGHYQMIEHFMNCSKDDLNGYLSSALKRLIITFASKDNHEVVKELIDHASKIKDALRDALTNAASEGHAPAVELLLNYSKVSIEAVKDSLLFAANNNHPEVVKLLLNDSRSAKISTDDLKSFVELWEHNESIEILNKHLILIMKKTTK